MTSRWPSWASAITSVVAQCFLVVQGIVVARTLGPEARGDLGWIQWAPPLISCLAAFGMTQALPALACHRIERGRPLFWSAFFTAFGLAIILSSIVAVVYWWTDWPASHLVGISVVFLILSPLEVVHSFPRDYLVAIQDFRSYDFLKLMQGALGCLAIVALSSLQILSPKSAALALLSVAFILGFVSWSVLGKTLRPAVLATRAEVAALLHFGGLCLLAGLAGVVQTRVLQWKIGTAFGTDTLGLFLVAATWGALGGPIWQVIQVRFYPAIARAQNDLERKAVFGRAISIGSGLCLAAIVVGYFVTPVIFPVLMGKKFIGGLALAQTFAIAAPFQAFGVFVGFCVRALGLAGMALIVDYIGTATTIGAASIFLISGGSEQTIGWAIGFGGLSSAILGSWLGLRKAPMS
jgi:O-antigen/teichoic acid export membrane protein